MNESPGKPLLRGVLHQVAAFVAAIAAGILVFTAPGPRARFGALVYGISLVTLLAVSAIYHRPTWPEKARRVLRRLDHSAIFFLIAGTYTPLSFLIRSRTGWMFLAIVWGGALVGIAISIFWVGAPKALVAAVCVLLGWAALPVLPAINAVLGTSAVVLLAAGGITYSVGAAVYALRKPDLYPKVFGYHELFHALVIIGAGFHFAAVARAVAALPA